MIHAVTNTKGGTGKSTIAFHILCSEAARLGRDFAMYELDEKNLTTEVFHNSKILDGRGQTLTLKYTVEAIGEAIFESIVENKEVIVDIGGGRDTDDVLNALANSGEIVRYYVPMEGKEVQITNAMGTIDMIEAAGGRANLIVNRTKGWTKDDCGADDIFGDKAFKIKGDDSILERVDNIYFIMENPYFGHAQRDNQLLGDFIQEGSIPRDEMKLLLSKLAMEKSKETGEFGKTIYSRNWKIWDELRKAYEFYQNIASQNILGL